MMTQILTSLPSKQKNQILCCYINATAQVHIIRGVELSTWYFERVVFPGQRLLFKAQQDSQIEIHTGTTASAILSDKIPCKRLHVNTTTSYEHQY